MERGLLGLPTPTETRLSIGSVLGGWGVGGVPRRPFPRGGGPPPSTKRCPCPPARTGVPEGVGDCSRWTSWTSDAIGANVSGVLHGVLVSPAMTCVPTTPATAGPGGLGWDKNFLAKERNFWIRVSVGNARADTVCMIMPGYSMDLDGERSDFSLFMTTRERQSARCWFTCCFILASEEDRISQSSRYRSRRTPREWAQDETAAKTHVNTCGAVDNPKHRALNW